MRAELFAVTAALALTAVLSVQARAQPSVPPGAPQRVIITGCPYAGVTASCLMIKTSEGRVYNITGMTPRPRATDRMIRLRGTVTDKLSMCNEGIVLDRIRWTRVRQQCTKQ
jgi:hypothetical protein